MGHNPSSWFLFKTKYFGDWILSQFSGKIRIHWAQTIEIESSLWNVGLNKKTGQRILLKKSIIVTICHLHKLLDTGIFAQFILPFLPPWGSLNGPFNKYTLWGPSILLAACGRLQYKFTISMKIAFIKSTLFWSET